MPRRHAVITGCVLAITALVPAAPAAAQSLPADTAAAATVWKPPLSILEALQRDLHLTKEEAQDRLLNEARLTEVEAQLREKLGDRFGGSWLSGKVAETLVVATTDPTDLPRIAAMGAQGKVVERSLAQLNAIRKKADEQQVGRVRYVSESNNKVVFVHSREQAREWLFQRHDGWPSHHHHGQPSHHHHGGYSQKYTVQGVDEAALIAQVSTEKPRIISDVVGGHPYYNGPISRCSIGFSVTKGAQNGFVTAGHCGKSGDAITDIKRNALGTFHASTFPASDFAWVALNGTSTPRPSVDDGSGNLVGIAGSKEALEGASVCRSGSSTGWRCGTVLQRDASVTYAQGIVNGLVRTNVCAEDGDSGGAFIWVDQALGVSSGGSGDCESGGFTYFQPIDPILTAYSLILLTDSGPSGMRPAPTVTPMTVTHTLTTGRSAN